MRVLLVLMLAGLIPLSYGDQESKVDENELVRQTEADDFNGLMYASPAITCNRNYGPITDIPSTSWDRVGGSSKYLESSDIKKKQGEDE